MSSPLLRILLIVTYFLFVEVSLLHADSLNINTTAYLDIYYQYDFLRPQTTKRLPFLYNHTRHHQLSLNHALVLTTLTYKRFTARAGVHAGSYVTDNYAQEPKALQWINEASIDWQIDSAAKHVLTAGIFPSHIGYESAVSFNNLCLSRSLMAENSPYFESGVKYGFRPNDAWSMSALVLTGWQRIRFAPNNTLPAVGTQLTYTTGKNYTYNWSSFAGSDTPDTARLMRYFSNVYVSSPTDKKWSYVLAFDFGLQQQSPESADYHSWHTANAVLRYAFVKNWNVAARAEYYSDNYGILLGSKTNVYGYSINLNYSPHSQLYIRAEYRYLQGSDAMPKASHSILFSAAMVLGW